MHTYSTIVTVLGVCLALLVSSSVGPCNRYTICFLLRRDAEIELPTIKWLEEEEVAASQG